MFPVASAFIALAALKVSCDALFKRRREEVCEYANVRHSPCGGGSGVALSDDMEDASHQRRRRKTR